MNYYPYLRGKQYELISLRGLNEFITNRNIVCPIIEPVKIGSTLSRTISTLQENGNSFILLLNPEYGDYRNKTILECWDKLSEILDRRMQDIHFGFLAHVKQNEISQIIEEKGLNTVSIVINEKAELTPLLSQLVQYCSFQEIIMADNRSTRRLMHGIDTNKIVISDRFNSKERNIEYLIVEDEFFSDDHKFYSEDGYSGFSDYVTIGDNYTESGFLPYAVAIHWTYLDQDENFRIRHLVSDSNEDNTDVPGKFGEALQHLIEFADINNLPNTYALREMRKYHDSGDYPGLGVLKKLSVLNHFELVHNYFSR